MMTPLVLLLPLACAHVQDEPRVYESMIVPYASGGLPDWAASEERERFVINVTLQGEVIHHGLAVEGPEALAAMLAVITTKMPKAQPSEGEAAVPAAPLLIRADLVGDFHRVLDVIEAGAALHLSEYHLAVGDITKPRIAADGTLLPNAGPERYLPLRLPSDEELGAEGQEGERLTLSVSVVEAGRKLEATRAETTPWKGAEGSRFRWDMTQRKVTHAIGPFETQDRTALQQRVFAMRRTLALKPVVLQVGPGVTTAEALFAYGMLQGLGANVLLTRG